MEKPIDRPIGARPVCELCGEPMPEGEEMFKYHGLSGDCPKPPLPRPKTEAVIEYIHRRDGEDYVLDIKANGELWTQFRFDTESERQRAHDDMLKMMRDLGGKDLPPHAM